MKMAELPGRVYRLGVLDGPTHDPDEPELQPQPAPQIQVKRRPHGEVRALILQAMKRHRCRTAVDIAERMGLSPSSVRDQLEVMASKGLAHRTGRSMVPSCQRRSYRGGPLADEWAPGPQPRRRPEVRAKVPNFRPLRTWRGGASA